MIALQLQEPGRFRQIELPEPAAPGPGQVLVQVRRVGICGTDIAGYLGKMPFFSYPRIPGHELGVEVLQVGPGVADVKPGDACAVEPYLNCQECSSCRRGHSNCCEQLKVLGVMTDGGMRDRFVVPARKLHPATKLSWEQLALVETLAIGCHAVHRGNPQPGESALVIGAGPIGLSALEFVRLSGARCIVMDVNQRRLDFVQQEMRISDVVLAHGGEPDIEVIRGRTIDGELPAIVIDATGNPRSMSRALAFAGFAGRAVYVGITQSEVSFPHAPVMHRRELTLLASRNALPADFTRIIRLIEDGRIDTRPWITHRTRLLDLPAVFPSFLNPECGVVKAIVEIS